MHLYGMSYSDLRLEGEAMKTIRLELWKAFAWMVAAVAIPAFIAGWLTAVNFSGVFETGYKIAFMDIKTGMREAVRDGQDFFYIEGIKLYPIGSKTAKTAAAEAENYVCRLKKGSL